MVSLSDGDINPSILITPIGNSIPKFSITEDILVIYTLEDVWDDASMVEDWYYEEQFQQLSLNPDPAIETNTDWFLEDEQMPAEESNPYDVLNLTRSGRVYKPPVSIGNPLQVLEKTTEPVREDPFLTQLKKIRADVTI